MLGITDFDLGTDRERRAALQLPGDRLDHRRMGVTVDQRGHIAAKVDAAHALDIGDDAAFAAHGIDRMGFAQDRVAVAVPPGSTCKAR